MKKKILVTGSAGFIFSNFIRKIEEYPEYDFVSIDKLVSPQNFLNIRANHTLHIGDIADSHFVDSIFQLEKPDIIINGAAESFVDASINNALPFIRSNVLGTQVMIDSSLKYGIEKFIQISTDEVFGQLKSKKDKSWTENSPLNPRNPYSASKAGAELIVKAAHETHGLQYLITRCSNNYGPMQQHRNLIPKVITSILTDQKIPIHGNGQNVREWIYVDDHCSAIMHLINKNKINDVYNIGSDYELSNLEVVDKICQIMGKGKELISYVKDRPGHDFRYSVDSSKLRKLGWKPQYDFDTGLEKCVKWYIDNKKYYLL